MVEMNHLILIDSSLRNVQTVGTDTTIEQQIKQHRRKNVKIISVSNWNDIRRKCSRMQEKCAVTQWDTVNLLLHDTYDESTKRVTILNTELCVDVQSREYKRGHAFKAHKRTMQFLRASVKPPDDAGSFRGVYVYACDYGSIHGVLQFFHVSTPNDAVPVFMSTNQTWSGLNQDWENVWGSRCGYEPSRTQRKHAKQHLFDRIGDLHLARTNTKSSYDHSPNCILDPGSGTVSCDGTGGWVVYSISHRNCKQEHMKLWIRYVSADPRPLRVLVDGVVVGEICERTTVTWDTKDAEWSASMSIPFDWAITHALRLETDDFFPHIIEYVLVPCASESVEVRRVHMVRVPSRNAG